MVTLTSKFPLPKFKDEEAAFTDNLLVDTISDSSHGWFIDDLENVQCHHFCDLPLRVIEVGGDSNDRGCSLLRQKKIDTNLQTMEKIYIQTLFPHHC